MRLIYIASFGLLGVFSRYYTGLVVSKFLFPPFPFGTFIINILGSFTIGVIYVLGVERTLLSPDLRVGIMVGFLGGFTTFSSFALESVKLFEDTEYFYGALYFILSPVLGYIATFAGMLIMRKIFGAST